jgi:hypothetical protein
LSYFWSRLTFRTLVRLGVTISRILSLMRWSIVDLRDVKGHLPSFKMRCNACRIQSWTNKFRFMHNLILWACADDKIRLFKFTRSLTSSRISIFLDTSNFQGRHLQFWSVGGGGIGSESVSLSASEDHCTTQSEKLDEKDPYQLQAGHTFTHYLKLPKQESSSKF